MARAISIPSTSRAQKPAKTRSARPTRPRARAGTRRRAGEKILHTCGHTQAHPLIGPKWKKDRERQRLQGVVCTACWSSMKAEELEAICDVALPSLTGTPRRILWARSLRALRIIKVQAEASRMDRERLEKELPPATKNFLSLVLPALKKQVAAKWWIDHRDTVDLLDLVLNPKVLDEVERLRQEAPLAPEPILCPF